ncbi:hypothetical protein WBJ53_23625 [Spirosoma sp. SC4-14]|uniref:hypothetical protein n=1 Tax=Spirosoma sp. SC4-14 TaxID=3128900 RepID=UPI0030D2B410
MKNHIYSANSFEVWINDQDTLLFDDTSTFDDNWIVSATDLFGSMDLPNDEEEKYYEEAA